MPARRTSHLSLPIFNTTRPSHSKSEDTANSTRLVTGRTTGKKGPTDYNDRFGITPGASAEYNLPETRAQLRKLLVAVKAIEDHIREVLSAHRVSFTAFGFGVYPGHFQIKGNGIAVEFYDGIPQRVLTPLGPTLGVELTGYNSAAKLRAAASQIREELGLYPLEELGVLHCAKLFQVSRTLAGESVAPVEIKSENGLSISEGREIFKQVWSLS